MAALAPQTIALDPKKRVLYLTKDLKLIKEQLYNGLQLFMRDLEPADLLDDINTDIMTPAWVCFHYDPKKIAQHAYAGLMHNGERIFNEGALMAGNFQAIVSGERKGTGSSRETAAQCEKFAGLNLVFAASFAPIHRRNNINLGQIMGSYDLLKRLENKEQIDISEFLEPFDLLSQKIIIAGGIFNFLKSLSHQDKSAKLKDPSPMTMAQKIMYKKLVFGTAEDIIHGKSIISQVDSGYSHEFTSAQVHHFLLEEIGEDYSIKNGQQFAAFEDHLIYADYVEKYHQFMPLIEALRAEQRNFIRRNNLRDYSAKKGISPGICHEVARQEFILPGDFIQATDSHTCMGGALNAFAYGVGASEYAAVLASGLSIVEVPASIQFVLNGELKKNCSAKDIMLYILLHYSKKGLTLNKVMEFSGPGLHALSIDERATLCNMATECGAKTGICEPDERLIDWLLNMRPNLSRSSIVSQISYPDKEAHYEKSYSIDLSQIEPMLAHPGNPDHGIASDPTNGITVRSLPETKIDIAYGGSCTAGKYDDIDLYAKVVEEKLKHGFKIPPHVRFYIQYGSQSVADYAKKRGFHQAFMEAGIHLIPPGCGACIGCGPGISKSTDEVTVSAINRNFQGRSGPGKLYLASPLTVAASAFAGKIVAWE